MLAHSDVAPTRKKDPGEKFPWARLAATGIGHWVAPEPVDRGRPRHCPRRRRPAGGDVQTLLRKLRLRHRADRRLRPLTEFVVTAFQRHFRPERVDGRIDQSTITTLERLAAALPAQRPA